MFDGLWQASILLPTLLLSIDIVARLTCVGDCARDVDNRVLVLLLRGGVCVQARLTEAGSELDPVGALHGRELSVRTHPAWNDEQPRRLGNGETRVLHRGPAAVGARQRIRRSRLVRRLRLLAEILLRREDDIRGWIESAPHQ